MLNKTNFSKSTGMDKAEADTRVDISVQVLANNWKITQQGTSSYSQI
jgi:hypothetical protein